MTTKDYLTVQEAAEVLGVTRFTVSRLVREGVLASYVSPLNRRQKLVKRDDIEALREPVPVKPARDSGKAAA
jgi:excisionase family DNA binding protein